MVEAGHVELSAFIRASQLSVIKTLGSPDPKNAVGPNASFTILNPEIDYKVMKSLRIYSVSF